MKKITLTLITLVLTISIFNIKTYANEVDLDDLFRKDASYSSEEEMPNVEEIVGDVLPIQEQESQEMIIQNENDATTIDKTIPTTIEKVEEDKVEDNVPTIITEENTNDFPIAIIVIVVAIISVILGVILFLPKKKDE